MSKVSFASAIDQAMGSIDRLDAQILLAHVIAKPKSYLMTWPDSVLSDDQCACFDDLVAQRASGYPLAYLTGIKSFWDLELKVTPAVLIPRPETELLVELALARLFPGARVLELATGSGAIACALARERPDVQITATDISFEALNIAQLNAKQYQLKNIEFILSDWFTAVNEQTFDFILANPPYLAETDPHLSTDIRFEPRDALVAGQKGDEDYLAIIAQAASYLRPQGWIMMEHGAEQGARLRTLLEANRFSEVFTERDLAGLERVTGGITPPPSPPHNPDLP